MGQLRYCDDGEEAGTSAVVVAKVVLASMRWELLTSDHHPASCIRRLHTTRLVSLTEPCESDQLPYPFVQEFPTDQHLYASLVIIYVSHQEICCRYQSKTQF